MCFFLHFHSYRPSSSCLLQIRTTRNGRIPDLKPTWPDDFIRICMCTLGRKTRLSLANVDRQRQESKNNYKKNKQTFLSKYEYNKQMYVMKLNIYYINCIMSTFCFPPFIYYCCIFFPAIQNRTQNVCTVHMLRLILEDYFVWVADLPYRTIQRVQMR